MPACNGFADTELAVGKRRVVAEGAPRIDSVVYSVKKVLIAGRDTDGSAGFNATTIRATGNASGTRQNSATAIFSHPLAATGGTLLHLNVGLVNDREANAGTGRNRSVWAAARESDPVGEMDDGRGSFWTAGTAGNGASRSALAGPAGRRAIHLVHRCAARIGP